MCGHGTIGTVTMGLENGLINPKTPGIVRLEAPAGLVVAEYRQEGDYVEEVRITNVPSFLHSQDLEIDCPGLGRLTVDVAYGGNFYAIVDPQPNFNGLEQTSVGDLLRWSPDLRRAMNARYRFVHPEKPEINGLSHIMWTGAPQAPGATARNAVFYGDKAIDRSPCGTGTSARMAQWFARGKLGVGDDFIHESIIGSIFKGRVEKAVTVGNYAGIVPSIAGWARQTGFNTILIDDRDPYAHGFSLV
jgi:4-hydroxyproline epimerase